MADPGKNFGGDVNVYVINVIEAARALGFRIAVGLIVAAVILAGAIRG